MHPVERDDYVLPTVAIEAFVNVVLSWIRGHLVGALVPGPQRIGKTCAIRYFIEQHRRWLQHTVGVVACEVGYHKVIGEAAFWGDLLRSMGHATTKSKIEARRDLFLGYLVEAGARSTARKVVVFIDEAQRLHEEQLHLLIGIHNELSNVYRVKATWILVGQPELEAFVATYLAQGKRQIIGRFMVDTYRFEPLVGRAGLEAALRCYDEHLRYPEQGPTFTEHFAPSAYAVGYRLHQDVDLVWTCLEDARRAAGLQSNVGMTMAGFTALANAFLRTYLPSLRAGDHLTKAVIDEAIIVTNCMIFEQQEALLSSIAPTAA